MLRNAVLREAVATADTALAAMPDAWQRTHE